MIFLQHTARGIILGIITATQPTIICSKLTIETPEQGVKYVQSFVLVSSLLTLNIIYLLL